MLMPPSTMPPSASAAATGGAGGGAASGKRSWESPRLVPRSTPAAASDALSQLPPLAR